MRRINVPKVKIPKISKLIKSTNSIINGLLASVLYSPIKIEGDEEKEEKPVIGAGRGGKHYGKTSAMGQMADSVAKPVRQKKKEITPYKPNPQMHTLWGIEDMRRGIV